MLPGGVIKMPVAYAGKRCTRYLFAAEGNRFSRIFKCLRCGVMDHTNCNAAHTIERTGLDAHGKGRMGAEDGGVRLYGRSCEPS